MKKQIKPVKWLALLCVALGSMVSVAEDTRDWGIRALNIQNQVDDYAPLSQTTWVGTHNSFANADDDNVSSPNQGMSLKKQMDQGVRELVFDLHYESGAVRLCHNNVTASFECVDGITGNRKFQHGLKDIDEWLDDNPGAVILLKLELAASAKNKLAKVQNQIENHILHRVYRTDNLSTHGDYGNKGCTELPTESFTKADVLATNKNVILYNTQNCLKDNDVNNYVFNTGDNMEDFNDSYKLPTVGSYDQISNMSRTKDGATKGGDNMKMSPDTVADYMAGGLNIFEMYGFSADGSAWKIGGEHPLAPENLVWTWDESSRQPINADGNCAMVSGSSDRFHVDSCTVNYAVACRQESTDGTHQWAIGASAGFSAADSACAAVGSGYVFAAPRNPVEMNSLVLAARGMDVWVNYTNASGIWFADIGE